MTITQAAHCYQVGDTIYLNGSTLPVQYANTSWTITATNAAYPNASTFSFSVPTNTAITQVNIAPHPNRVNNWSAVYSVSFSGNCIPETNGVGAAGVYGRDFIGLKTIGAATGYTNQLPLAQPPATSTNTAAYAGFTKRKSFDGTSSGAGGGDYSLLPTSPAINNQADFLIPFDINGNPRLAQDAAGSYGTQKHRALLLIG